MTAPYRETAPAIDAEAEDEIAHAIDRYAHEREGLGSEFWDELRTAMRTFEAPGPECGERCTSVGGDLAPMQVVQHRVLSETEADF